MAKRGRPPKNNKGDNVNKDVLAKQKVEDLLRDVPLPKKDKDKLASKLEEQQEKRTTKWLEEQLDVFSKENEKLKKEAEEAKENYKKLFDDYQKLKQGGVVNQLSPETDGELKNKILLLFQKFERQYLGINPEKTQYNFIKMTTQSNSGLLDEFLKAFPFIANSKKSGNNNKKGNKPTIIQHY